jgi:hypothetical protein
VREFLPAAAAACVFQMHFLSIETARTLFFDANASLLVHSHRDTRSPAVPSTRLRVYTYESRDYEKFCVSSKKMPTRGVLLLAPVIETGPGA